VYEKMMQDQPTFLKRRKPFSGGRVSPGLFELARHLIKGGIWQLLVWKIITLQEG